MSRIQAYRWTCDDDCAQYVIDRTTPHPVTRGFVNRERLWEGAFRSYSSDVTRSEQAADLREFRKAARRWGVRLRRQPPFGGWAGDSAGDIADREAARKLGEALG